MSKNLNIIGLQPTMEIAPTQLTIGATSTANELKLETTYNNLLEDGSTIFTTVGGITTPHVVGTVVKTQGTAPVTTTKTITGNTTTINNSPFNNSTVPTLGNMIIVSNTARAIADNASATTFNFNLSSGNDILELQPSMKILLESIEIDPASTTSSLVLNSPYNNYIVDGTPLILDQAGIVTQVIAGTVVKTATTTPTNVTFTITGATTSLPTLYAFNSSNVTVSNMTIASNVATATANAASATTFEYAASGDVTEAQAIAILQPTELEIDPSSTTGSIKVNYTTNNLLQIGSKVLVTDGGVTTEQTIAAGSQTSIANLQTNQQHVSAYANGKYFTWDSNYLWISDDFQVWIKTNLNIVVSNPFLSNPFLTVCYFNSMYYTTIQGVVYRSSDGLSWTSTFTGAFTAHSGITTNGSILCLAVSSNNASGIIIYSSNDGVSFTSRYTATPTGGTNCLIWGFGFSAGKFTLAATFCGGVASNDGINWALLSPPAAANVSTFSLIWDGTAYIIAAANTTGTAIPIWRSTTGTSWTSVLNIGIAYCIVYYTSGKYLLLNYDGTTYYTSTDGITWNSATLPGTGNPTPSRTLDLSVLKVFRGPPNATNTLTIVAPGYTTFNTGTTSVGYQFTITSPSLPVPDAMYLGGQVLQSNVGGAGWVTHTVTYSDSAGTITFTGNNRTGLTGDTVQIRMTTINNTEILSYFRGNLVVETADGYTYTCSAFDTPLTSVPIKAYKGGQTLLSSCTATNTPSLVAVSSYTYTRSGDIITYTGNNRTGLAGLYVQLRAATLNENDILTYFGYTYLSLDPTSGWTYTCTNINPRLTTLPGDVYYGDQQVQTNVELAGWQTHAVSEIVSIAANTFRVAYTSISSEPGKDVQLRVQDLAEEDEVSRMKLTITQD